LLCIFLKYKTNSKIKKGKKRNKILEKKRKLTLDNGGSSPKLGVAAIFQNGGSKLSFWNK
jgi:hypothetical protein